MKFSKKTSTQKSERKNFTDWCYFYLFENRTWSFSISLRDWMQWRIQSRNAATENGFIYAYYCAFLQRSLSSIGNSISIANLIFIRWRQQNGCWKLISLNNFTTEHFLPLLQWILVSDLQYFKGRINYHNKQFCLLPALGGQAPCHHRLNCRSSGAICFDGKCRCTGQYTGNGRYCRSKNYCLNLLK